MTTAIMLPLRPYQLEGIEAVETDWAAGVRRPAVVWPTGAGKTVGFAHLAARWRARNRSRVLVLAHRAELIEQAAAKLRMIAPHLSVGVFMAARKETSADVIVGSVQTVRTDAALARLSHIGMIIVDECHHATAPTYRKILTHFGCFSDETVHVRELTVGRAEPAVAVGFTATLARGDDENLGEIWQKVSNRKDILWMIRRGYLLDVFAKRVQVDDLDLSRVRTSGGDYREGDLGEAMMESLAPELSAKAYAEHAADRSGVLFAPTVESAYAFAEAFNEVGIKTETVHGALPSVERRAIFDRCHDGTTQVLANCMVATEGTDVPRWSCAVIARPTQSSPLYQQMVGRVLRPFPGQGAGQPIEKALVLDVTGVTGRHTLRSLIDLTGQKYREEIKLDESLLEHDEFELSLESELGQRNESQGAGLDWEYATGPTKTVEVDLFADSRQQWLQTDGGAWFLPGGPDHLVFLVPEPGGRYAIAWAHKTRIRPPGHGGYVLDDQGTPHRGLELGYAMSWGEDAASRYDGAETLMSKGTSWRKAKHPSEAQKKFARGLGIDFADDIRKGELSDLISTRVASRRIDPIVTALMNKKG